MPATTMSRWLRTPDGQQQGQTPDYRFSLANERTFLAWIRTVMALLAGAVLFQPLAQHMWPGPVAAALAVGVCALAAFLSVLAFSRWRANELAMRLERPLPHTALLPLLSSSMAAVAVGLAVLLWGGP